MRRVILLMLTIFGPLAAACAHAQTAPPAAHAINSDPTCEIIGLVLDTIDHRMSGSPLLLRASTLPTGLGISELRPGEVDSTTVKSFIAANVAAGEVCREIRSRFELIISAERTHERTTFSAVVSGIGFNRDSTEAMLFVATGCGTRCGGGSVVVLRRRSTGRWFVHLLRGIFTAQQ